MRMFKFAKRCSRALLGGVEEPQPAPWLRDVIHKAANPSVSISQDPLLEIACFIPSPGGFSTSMYTAAEVGWWEVVVLLKDQEPPPILNTAMKASM